MSRLPAPGALEGASGAGEAEGVPRLGLLGSAGGRLRGSQREDGDRRPGAGSARRESNRPRLHRGRRGGLSLLRAPPGRLRQPGGQHASRRWSAAYRGVHPLCCPLRPAGQSAQPRRASAVRSLSRSRARIARRPGAARPRGNRLGRSASPFRSPRHRFAATLAALRARRGASPRWSPASSRQLPCQPSKHADGQIDAKDVRRRADARERAARLSVTAW